MESRTDSYRAAAPHAGPPTRAAPTNALPREDRGNLAAYPGSLQDHDGGAVAEPNEPRQKIWGRGSIRSGVPSIDAVMADGRDAETRRTLSFITAFFIAAAVIISVASASTENRYNSLYPEYFQTDRSAFFVVFGFYLCLMLAVAYISSLENASVSLKEIYTQHFLAGSKLSGLAMFTTLFSTTFSGYTVVGVPNEAAGLGFIAFRWFAASGPMLVFMVLFYPRFYAISKARGYSCPTDLITDRYNNRIVSVLVALALMANVLVYVVVQFYSLAQLLPLLSGELLNPRVVVFFIAAIIFVCEITGGFEAVVRTDNLQSGIMIVALVTIPILFTYYHGYMTEHVEMKCDGFELLNCTALYEAGDISAEAKCMELTDSGKPAYVDDSSAVPNGCMVDTNMWFTLHPATKTSHFFERVDVARPHLEGGIDKGAPQFPFSYTGAKMFSFMAIMFSFPLNPHMVQRPMAAKSAVEMKKGLIAMSFSVFVATLPSILLGLIAASTVAMVWPFGKGLNMYGIVLSDLMDNGGFSEFAAVLGGVAAIAAVMSTIDSAVLALTNIFTQDFLRNWLFAAYPDLETPVTIKTCCNMLSGIFVIVSVYIALEDADLNDPELGTAIYGKLIMWQAWLLWQALPAFMLGIYTDRITSTAVVCGIVTGVISQVVLFVYGVGNDDQVEVFGKTVDGGSLFNTRFFPDEVNNYKLDSNIISSFCNVAVCLLVAGVQSIVSTVSTAASAKEELPSMLNVWRVGHARWGGGARLTADEIDNEIMSGTEEPAKSTAGRLLLVGSLVLSIFTLPFFGESYSGCDIVTMSTWKSLNNIKNDEPATWAMLKGGTAALGEDAPNYMQLKGVYGALSGTYFTAGDAPPFITTPITDNIDEIPDQTFMEMMAYSAWVVKYNMTVANISGFTTGMGFSVPPVQPFPKPIPPLNGCKGYDLTNKHWPVWAVTCLVGSCIAIAFVVAALWITYKPPREEDNSAATSAAAAATAVEDGVEKPDDVTHAIGYETAL